MGWVKDVTDFLNDPRKAVVLFLSCFICAIPSVRHSLPVHGAFGEYFDLAVSVGLPISFTYLLVSCGAWSLTKVVKWKKSRDRAFRRALKKATPVEKMILHALISVNEALVDLTPGTRTALHLQELGLILYFPSGETFAIPALLSQLCLREPKLLQLSEEDGAKGMAELQKWREEGQEERLFQQISQISRGPGPNDWMSR